MGNSTLQLTLLLLFVTVQCLALSHTHRGTLPQRNPRQSSLYTHGQKHLKPASPASYQSPAEPYSSDEEYPSKGRPKAITLHDGCVVSATKDDNVKIATPGGIEVETYPSWIRVLVQDGPTSHVTKLGAIKVVEDSGDVVFLGNTGGVNWNRADGTLITVNNTDATVTISGTTVQPTIASGINLAKMVTPEGIQIQTFAHGIRQIDPKTQINKIFSTYVGGINVTRLDGAIVALQENSSTIYYQPKGDTIIIEPNGQTSYDSKGLLIKSDGTVIQTLADGTIHTLNPDLTIKTEFFDGTSQTLIRSQAKKSESTYYPETY